MDNQQPSYQMSFNQQKKDAFDALSDKVAAFMQTNPVLKAIASGADIISYFVTTISVIMTIVVMCLGGTYQIFTVTALLFGFFSMAKKNLLPFTITLSIMSTFNVVNFILTIVALVNFGPIASMVISFIFSIIEMLIIGYFTALAWIYFMAMLPPRAYQPQQSYSDQPVQQSEATSVQQSEATSGQQSEATSGQKFCSACGAAVTNDAAFCRVCGNKL